MTNLANLIYEIGVWKRVSDPVPHWDYECRLQTPDAWRIQEYVEDLNLGERLVVRWVEKKK